MRRTPALALALVLTAALLTACGSDQPVTSTDESETTDGTGEGAAGGETGSDIADVTVTGDPGDKPELEFDTPFGVGETANRVLTEGDGETVSAGTTVSFDYVIVNATDGTEVDTSYGTKPTSLSIDTAPPVLAAGLIDQKVGARVLIAIAAKDGFGADEERGVAASDTLLVVADILGVITPLTRAEGTAVTPPGGLPTVTLDVDGAPTITVPETDPPAELVAQPLIEGDGATVEAGQTITVHYTGVLWDGGTVFDSSWEGGAPATFSIGTGGVIPGWDKGLVGRTIGSQILLVIPSEDGYGEAGSGATIPPNATLVFVVDILAAS